MPKKIKKLFDVTVQWSQTEQEHYLIQADSKDQAKEIIRQNMEGFSWINGVSEISDMTHLKLKKQRRVLNTI